MISLNVRVFKLDLDLEKASDTELMVDSAEIEHGTLWIYVKEKKA